ncbi:MAG: hypothetical protein CBARDCOR_3591 [uncultured Caballeronia sp.]|nr:MAG: hypothetical protein CBARDCOR_3591 [uncultured Caballeronia sp.]
MFDTLKGKNRGAVAWVVGFWLGLWAVALVYHHLGRAALVRLGRILGLPGARRRRRLGVLPNPPMGLWGHVARANYATHGQETVVRGTEVVGGGDLQARIYGDKAKAADVDIEIGSVVIPRMLEAQHMLFSGTTGAGKAQAINPRAAGRSPARPAGFDRGRGPCRRLFLALRTPW